MVKVINLDNGLITKVLTDTFQRFKLHYEFKEVFMNSKKLNEKGLVKQAVRYMRRNLLVTLPEFDNFEEYNKELLKKSKDLLKREHYVLKQSIIDLHLKILMSLINYYRHHLSVHQ